MPAAPRLSLVIAAYAMERQLPRTIRSLSPGMQANIEAGDYELIVVDNGSPRPLDRAGCEEWGAPLRWLRIDDAPPSPGRALNLGIAAARAPLVGAMIDGARLASPGLLAHALIAARIDPRPIIASRGFHLGFEPQQSAVGEGYDESVEAALLRDVDWLSDGYRLFDISVPARSSRHGWFEVPAESNAIFMPSELWDELGGFDEHFAAPGGGLVNHDLFARACALPDSQLIMLLGEATFHQVHGGVSTNSQDPQYREFDDEYERRRGARYRRPETRPVYLGTLSSPASAALGRSFGHSDSARMVRDVQ